MNSPLYNLKYYNKIIKYYCLKFSIFHPFSSVHRQFRTLTKTKGAFPNDDSLLKLLFMGIKNAEQKWTMPIRNWSLTLSQLAIHFEGRLDDSLNL